MKTESTNVFASSFLQALLSGNRKQCSKIAADYLKADPSFINLYENVLKKALYEIGRLWETNQISVAAEHLATAITEAVLNELFAQLISNKRLNNRVMLTTVENEQHQVGLRMVADVFEMHGWETYYLGVGFPLEELIPYIAEVQPNILAISWSIPFNFDKLKLLTIEVGRLYPNVTLLIGGQALQEMSPEQKLELKNFILIPNLYVLEQFIHSQKSSA